MANCLEVGNEMKSVPESAAHDHLAMKRQRLFILLSLVAMAGLLLWQFRRDPRGRVYALADGSKIIFLGVTVGTNHIRSYGGLLQQMIASLPGPLRDKFADTTLIRANIDGQTNAVFWFRIRKNPALKKFVYIQPTTNGGAKALFRSKFKDELGQNLTNNIYNNIYGLQNELPSGDYAYAAWATNFPSTSREVRLWMYRPPVSQEEVQPLEFRALNPFYPDKR